MENESSLTVTITRNSDGIILENIQCNVIFAGFGILNDGGASYELCENATGGMILTAAECAERAIHEREERDPAFKNCRFLKSMLYEIEEYKKEQAENE